MAFHQRVRAGERDLFELAETGYLAALKDRSDSAPLAMQLARLYYENGRFDRATRAAVYCLDLEPGDAECLEVLAASAYHAGEMELALWAVEAGRRAGSLGAAAMRPLILAAAGLPEDARTALSEGLASGLVPAARGARLSRRLDQWRDLYVQTQATGAPPTAGAPPGAFGGAAPAAPVAPPGAAIDFSPPQPATPATAQGAVSYAWWDCQQQLNQMAGAGAYVPSYGSYGTSSADETTPLPALPAPCKGQPLPRMVMMDAVLLRSEDVQSAGRGLNLLDNLSIFLANTVTVNRTFGTAGPSIKSTTVTQTLGLGATPGGGIGYSLNIANASDQRAEVLARPTLLALDRQPAEFFSGSTVSVALVSVQGGGTVEDKPVGVSLSVTPTFIDDDTMLVSVKAVRSFFETTAPSATFEQSVQTSRNMVTANVLLRFGETLILSGLTEREITNTNSRTPALGDVPGLQYLFGRQTRRDYTRSIMVLLTPRRVATFAETLAQADSVSAHGGDHSLMAEARDRARRDVAQTQPNAVAALKHMERNRLFRALRSNDIEVQGWRQPDRVRRFVTDLTELIYF